MAFRLITLLLTMCLFACSSVPAVRDAGPVESVIGPYEEDIAVAYAALASPGGRLFRLNPKTSNFRAFAFRAGRASRFGHNHVVSAPAFDGFFYLAPDGPAASRFDLAFRLDQLVFDVPEHRAELGPAFASTISAEDTASTRNNMLGDNNFQAARFPWLRLQSLQIVGEAPKFAVKLAITLHGQTREIWTPLTVTGLSEQLKVQGALVLKQSDFGIKPFSVFGGILAVHDEVVVEFTFAGDPQ